MICVWLPNRNEHSIYSMTRWQNDLGIGGETFPSRGRTYGHGGNTMKKGTITKLLHKGQKVYGVITGFDEASTTVRFPFCGVSGTVEICEVTVPKSDCR